MKRGNFAGAVSVVLFLSLGSSVFPQSSADVKPKPTETQPAHLTRREILKRLQLTDDQHKRLLKHRAAYRHTMAVLDSQLKVKQVDLENELEKPEPDQAKLDLIVQEIGVLYGQRLGEKVKAKLELEKNILTPQQVDLLKSLQGKEVSATDEGL